MLTSFAQLEDVPQVALERARSTDQETSRPPERVQFKDLYLFFFSFLLLIATACLVFFLKKILPCSNREKSLILSFNSPFPRLIDLLLHAREIKCSEYEPEMICLRS